MFQAFQFYLIGWKKSVKLGLMFSQNHGKSFAEQPLYF